MSLVAGIDYSTHAVDVVWLDEDSDRAEWQRIPLDGHDAFERTRSLRIIASSQWWDEVLAVGIEEPRGYNAGALYRVQGAILACLPRSVLVQPWAPNVWRKAVGLGGGSTKAQVTAWVLGADDDGNCRGCGNDIATIDASCPVCLTALDKLNWPQDACDAYCIALATRNALEKEAAA